MSRAIRPRMIGAALAATALTLVTASGCDTIGQDINDAMSGFNSIKPAQAARMMVDPYNADNRRQGTVLISNSSFGGVDVYLAIYRDMVANERDPIVTATAI